MTSTTAAAAHPIALPLDLDTLVARYIAVWSEPDPAARRRAIAALWAPDGVEYVEGAHFRGHERLADRITEAYQQFVASGTYAVTAGDDAADGHGVVTFTIQLIARQGADAGHLAWSARVLLVLDEAGRIREDYHLTVKALAT
ncbi:nuclear transport factor 2 family protein [Kitasatospora sp. NBC_01287]|uniref:nuclear transport factor 2 family protein n=1 Tax=Kitasatospora sp. NBC_01287 TaxID=2903573 RepID=UPI00224FFA1A|nr:nuclear transport factor 2 family protein [Kitasatospora sp. NBC_01287]MCX4750309.1 nuclear transport factor 2 family protein [Kitasatospora sp. NBC_01287]